MKVDDVEAKKLIEFVRDFKRVNALADEILDEYKELLDELA